MDASKRPLNVDMKWLFKHLITMVITLLLLSTTSWAIAPLPSAVVANPPSPSIENKQGSAVKLGDQTIFLIQSRIGSFTPEFRAEVISKRIEKFAKDLSISRDSLELIKNGETSTYDIKSGKTLLMTIAPVDAAAAGTTERDLAEAYLLIINESVDDFRRASSFQSILRGAIYSLLSTAFFIFVFLALTRSTPYVYR